MGQSPQEEAVAGNRAEAELARQRDASSALP